MPDDQSIAPPSWADLLIPGDDRRWPNASAALGEAAIAEILRTAFEPGTHAAWLEANPSVEALAMTEATSPETFERVIGALYQAYYTSAPVRAVIDMLGAAGPRRSSPHFDDALPHSGSEGQT